MDDIATADHPLYLSAYGITLVACHVLSSTFFVPSNPGGKVSAGNVAVTGHRYANKIAGVFHACVLAFVAIRCYLTKGFDPYAERLLETPPLEHMAVGFMIVYLVYDTTFMFWRLFVLQPSNGVKEKWSFNDHTMATAHHILGLWSWWLIYSGTGGVYWAQWIHVAELSTPILNVRFIMMQEGIRSGPLYLVVSGLFLVLFFLSRIPTTSMLLYYMFVGVDKWPSRAISWFQFGVTFCFWCINMIWFNAGLSMAMRAVRGKKRKE